MEFLICRTSIWEDEKCPFDDEKEGYKKSYIDNDGDVVTAWFKKFNSLEELASFRDKYGEIIIRRTFFEKDGINTIEIYDDYRE